MSIRRSVLAAGHAVTTRVPWIASFSHRHGSLVAGPFARLLGSCRLDGARFGTRASVITLRTAGDLLLDRYEAQERRALAAVLDPDLPVIECGASIGVLACLVNRQLANPDAHVAIEANPDLLPLLERHRQMNGARFHIRHAAVAYDGPTVSFARSRDSLAGSLTGSGLREPVPAVTVDQVAREAGFAQFGLLCDIEGAEMAILRHDEAALTGHAAWVVMESHRAADGRDLAPEVIGWFVARGFRHVGTWYTVHGFVNEALRMAAPVDRAKIAAGVPGRQA